MSMMPTFFAKFLESQVPAERFSELLRGAAQAAFVRPEELSKLAISEIGKAIDALRAQRSPNLGEIQRLSELMDQLGPSVAEDAGLNEKLVKAAVMAELHDGRVPDAVTVAGPLPIRLARGETIVWIFNRVEAYGGPTSPADEPDLNPLAAVMDKAPGSSPPLHADQPSAGETVASSKGDMVITNRHVHLLLNGGRQEQMPIAGISSLETYPHGIQVSGRSPETFSWMLLLDDPPFAVNVLGGLKALVSG